MTKITFLPDNITTESPAGSSLLDAARSCGIFAETPCGCKGTCKKCLVNVTSDNRQEKESGNQQVLFCQALVPDEPVTVTILQSVKTAEGKFENFEDPYKYLNGSDESAALNCGEKFIEKITLQISSPALLDGLSDADRFSRAFLKAACKSNDSLQSIIDLQSVDLPLNVLSTLPEKLRDKDGEVTAHYYINNKIAYCLLLTVNDVQPPVYGLAVDIGTTTVALWLVDLNTNKVLSSHNAYNSQIECGLDVISRINYAKKHLVDLKSRILKTINELTAQACEYAGIESTKILCVSLAGNTTMIHLLLGIVPEYIRLSPYTPAVFNPQVYTAQQIGIETCENAPVLIAPAVGSYVGGDITAGLLCTSIAQAPRQSENKLILFIDIGTNGEIVLGNNDFMFACACSAGPAFEGGGIKHGVRAQKGAIERVVINEDGKAKTQTIGGAAPIGICGSGIISAVAELFKKGIIDSAGKFTESTGEYVLYNAEADAQSSQGVSCITICENDISNFIRAKGAIFSACQTLLACAGMTFEDVDKVYVAGGFGRFLDLDDARTVGLLPRLSKKDLRLPQKDVNDNYSFIGNSSVIGAYLSLACEEQRNKMHELAGKITYVDLSSESSYMDFYTGALFLPHTDSRLFE